jgi:hypothetical protein
LTDSTKKFNFETSKEIVNMDTKINLPLSFKQVLDIVKQLSPSEKQHLSEFLWTEQNINDIVIPEEHKQIVRQRIKKYVDQPNSYLSWEDIERKVAARK